MKPQKWLGYDIELAGGVRKVKRLGLILNVVYHRTAALIG